MANMRAPSRQPGESRNTTKHRADIPHVCHPTDPSSSTETTTTGRRWRPTIDHRTPMPSCLPMPHRLTTGNHQHAVLSERLADRLSKGFCSPACTTERPSIRPLFRPTARSGPTAFSACPSDSPSQRPPAPPDTSRGCVLLFRTPLERIARRRACIVCPPQRPANRSGEARVVRHVPRTPRGATVLCTAHTPTSGAKADRRQAHVGPPVAPERAQCSKAWDALRRDRPPRRASVPESELEPVVGEEGGSSRNRPPLHRPKDPLSLPDPVGLARVRLARTTPTDDVAGCDIRRYVVFATELGSHKCS